MRGVDISMCFMSAGQAPECVPLAGTKKPAPGTSPASLGRVNLGHAQATDLRFVLDGGAEFSPLPKGKAAAQGFAANAASLWLRDTTQVLKNEHCVDRNPLHECRSRLTGKGAGAVALLAAKPFERAANASCVLTLCLSGRKFALEPRTGFSGSTVSDLHLLPGRKEDILIWVHSDKGVGLIQINADRENAPGLWHFKGQGDSTKQPAVPFYNGQAVDLLGSLEGRLEGFWHGIAQAFATCYCPDRECSVGPEVSIPTAFTDEEQGVILPENQGTRRGLPVAFSTDISGRDLADGRDGHLAVESPLDRMVGSPLQRNRAERAASIEGNGRKLGLDLTKGIKRLSQVLVRFDHDGYGALNVHHVLNITHSAGNSNQKEGQRLRPMAKARGTRRCVVWWKSPE